ncbi:excisionase [Acidovorax sp. Leaf84]|uniref:excisionase n=1 Tax=Acidovorax sp. Leaf84 TaxID=1736240 RepID=UPI001F43D2F9|nr:excisionase [Acidovorax sp. Leaf84]
MKMAKPSSGDIQAPKTAKNAPYNESHFVTQSNRDAVTVPPQPEWVLASKYQDMTGVTRETVKQRKKSGVWKEGQQVAVIARRLYVNVKAADQWINDQLSPQRRRA